jgi:hypothetical protein
MRLATRLADDFSATVRNRGKSYFWQGRVRIQRGTASRVEARVRGSRNYEVSLDWQDGALSAWCDCPHFDSDGACKHLWATILAADGFGYLSAAAAADIVLESDGFDEEDPRSAGFATQPAVVVQPAKRTPPPPPPAWKNEIIAISSRCLQAVRPADEWPGKRDVVYVVDVSGSVSAGSLLLRLASRDRKADGSYTRAIPLALKRSRIAQLPLPEDREIVSTLAGGVQQSGWGYSRDSDQVPDSCLVAHPLAGLIMPLAIRTQRCYLRDSRQPDELMPLTWDEGDAWEFALEMRRAAGRHGKWPGVFRRGEERMDIACRGSGHARRPGVHRPIAWRRLRKNTPFEWISYFRKAGRIEAPKKRRKSCWRRCSARRACPRSMPEELRYEEVTVNRGPVCESQRPIRHWRRREAARRVMVRLRRAHGAWPEQTRRVLRCRRAPACAPRFAAERAAASLLDELGLKFRSATYWDPEPGWELAPTKLPRTVRRCWKRAGTWKPRARSSGVRERLRSNVSLRRGLV